MPPDPLALIVFCTITTHNQKLPGLEIPSRSISLIVHPPLKNLDPPLPNAEDGELYEMVIKDQFKWRIEKQMANVTV